MHVPFSLLAVPLCALSLLAPVSLHAQVYKWVDERGVVNYSNEPPKDVVKAKKAEPVPDDRLSVYSASREPPAPSSSAGSSRPERTDVLRDRIELLERELELERRQRAMSAQDEADRKRRAYDQCVLHRGVDCEALFERPGLGPAVVVVPQVRRPHSVPTTPLPAASVKRIRDERPTRVQRPALTEDGVPMRALTR
jgi:hypothetical protein